MRRELFYPARQAGYGVALEAVFLNVAKIVRHDQLVDGFGIYAGIFDSGCCCDGGHIGRIQMIVRISTLRNTGYLLELADDLYRAIHKPLVVPVIEFGPGKILIRPDVVRYKTSCSRDQSAHRIGLEIY